MPETEEKKSWPRRYSWQIFFFVGSSLFTIVGAIIRAQSEADFGIIWVIGGALLSATIFLGTLTLKVREDVNEMVEEKIGGVESKFRVRIDEIRNNLASVWTPTNEINLDVAKEITQKVGREGKQGLAYDTSSHHNPPEYEAMVFQNLKEGVRYERLICFDPEADKDESVAKWYFQLVDGRLDTTGEFDEWRKMIKDGRLVVLHLPRRLDMDILVTSRKGTNKCDALLGFTTQDTYVAGVYTTGLYIPTPTQMVDKNLANDIYALFKKLWREAIAHARDQTTLEPEKRCHCVQFVKKVHGDLVTIVPIDRPIEDHEEDSD
jgi:hypothetical protein